MEEFSTKNVIIGQVNIKNSINKINVVKVPMNKRVPISQQPSNSTQFYNLEEIQINMSVMFSHDDLLQSYTTTTVNPATNVYEIVDIYSGLEQLIQQFEVTPFITIYNEQLQRIVNTQTDSNQLPYQTNVVLHSISFQTIEDIPGSIIANMTLLQIDLGSLFNSTAPNFVAYKTHNESNQFTQKAYTSQYFKSLINKKIVSKRKNYKYVAGLTGSDLNLGIDIIGGFDKQIYNLENIKSIVDQIVLSDIDYKERNKYTNQKEYLLNNIDQMIKDIEMSKQEYYQNKNINYKVKPVSFRFGYENYISPISIQSSSKLKKYQYMGRTGMICILEFLAEDIGEIQKLNGFVDTLIEYSGRLKEIGVNQPLIINNPLLNRLFGDITFFIDTLQYTNIDDNPGQFSVTLNLVEHVDSSTDGFVIDENKVFIDSVMNAIYEDIGNLNELSKSEEQFFTETLNMSDIDRSVNVYHHYGLIDSVQSQNVIKQKLANSNVMIDLFIADTFIVDKNINQFTSVFTRDLVDRCQSINIIPISRDYVKSLTYNTFFSYLSDIDFDENRQKFKSKQTKQQMAQLLYTLELVSVDLVNVNNELIPLCTEYIESKFGYNQIFINPVHYYSISNNSWFNKVSFNKNRIFQEFYDFIQNYMIKFRPNNFYSFNAGIYNYMFTGYLEASVFNRDQMETFLQENGENIYQLMLGSSISNELIGNTGMYLRDYILTIQLYNQKNQNELKRQIQRDTVQELRTLAYETINIVPVFINNSKVVEGNQFSVFDYKNQITFSDQLTDQYISFVELKQSINNIQDQYLNRNIVNENIQNMYIFNLVLYKSLLLSHILLKDFVDEVKHVIDDKLTIKPYINQFINVQTRFINWNLQLQNIQFSVDENFQCLILMHQIQQIVFEESSYENEEMVLDDTNTILITLQKFIYKTYEPYLNSYIINMLGSDTFERIEFIDIIDYGNTDLSLKELRRQTQFFQDNIKFIRTMNEQFTFINAVYQCSNMYDNTLYEQFNYNMYYTQYYEQNKTYFTGQTPILVKQCKHLSNLTPSVSVITRTLYNQLDKESKEVVFTEKQLELIESVEQDNKLFDYDPKDIFQNVISLEYQTLMQFYLDILQDDKFIDLIDRIDKDILYGNSNSLEMNYNRLTDYFKNKLKGMVNDIDTTKMLMKDDVDELIEIFTNQIDVIATNIEKLKEELYIGGSNDVSMNVDGLMIEDSLVVENENIDSIVDQYEYAMSKLEASAYTSTQSVDFNKYNNLAKELINKIYGAICGLDQYEINVGVLQPKQVIAFLQRDVQYAGNLNKFFGVVTRLYYKDIVSINVHKSKDNPGNTAQIVLQNKNQSILSQSDNDTNLLVQSLINTQMSSIFTDILVSPGTEIQVYQGTGKSIYDLDVMFQGRIQQLEIGETVNIIQDSYGQDLVTPVDIDEQNTKAFIYINPTDLVLNQLFDSKSVNLGSYKGINTGMFGEGTLINNVVQVQNYQLREEFRKLGTNVYYPVDYYYKSKDGKHNATFRNVFFNYSNEIVNNPYKKFQGYSYWDIIVDSMYRIPDFVQYVDDFGVGEQRLYFGKRNWSYNTRQYSVIDEDIDIEGKTVRLKEDEFDRYLDSIGNSVLPELFPLLNLEYVTQEQVTQKIDNLKQILDKDNVDEEIHQLIGYFKRYLDDQYQFINYVINSLENEELQDLTKFKNKFKYFLDNYGKDVEQTVEYRPKLKDYYPVPQDVYNLQAAMYNGFQFNEQDIKNKVFNSTQQMKSVFVTSIVNYDRVIIKAIPSDKDDYENDYQQYKRWLSYLDEQYQLLNQETKVEISYNKQFEYILFQRLDDLLTRYSINYQQLFKEPYLYVYPEIEKLAQEFVPPQEQAVVKQESIQYMTDPRFKPDGQDHGLYIRKGTLLYEFLGKLDKTVTDRMFNYDKAGTEFFLLQTQLYKGKSYTSVQIKQRKYVDDNKLTLKYEVGKWDESYNNYVKWLNCYAKQAELIEEESLKISKDDTVNNFQDKFQLYLSKSFFKRDQMYTNKMTGQLLNLARILKLDSPDGVNNDIINLVEDSFGTRKEVLDTVEVVPVDYKQVMQKYKQPVIDQLVDNLKYQETTQLTVKYIQDLFDYSYAINQFDNRVTYIKNMDYKFSYNTEDVKYIRSYINNLNSYLLNKLSTQDFFLRLDVVNTLKGYEPMQKTYYLNDRLNIIENRLQTNINNVQTQYNVYGPNGFINNKGWFSQLLSWLTQSNQQDTTRIEGDNYVITKQLLDYNIPDYLNLTKDYIDKNAYTSPVRKIIQQNKLSESLRDFYEGSIVILGNTKIKPYDLIEITDSKMLLEGKAEVKSVTHMYDIETGFLTLITPQMVVDTQIPENISKQWNSYMYMKLQLIAGIAVSVFSLGAALPVWLGGLQFFLTGNITDNIGKNLVLNQVDSKSKQQHTLETIYNSQVIEPISLGGKLLTPKFEHYKFEPLGKYDLVKYKLDKTLDYFVRGFTDVFLFNKKEYIRFTD